MIINQSVPKLSWLHKSPDKVQVRLCSRHAELFKGEGYKSDIQENTKLKVFMPKLRAEHELGDCENCNCTEKADYIAYGVKYQLSIITG